ncbi:DUF3048 domain-containing protein [Actinotalea sp. K2]|uniref:DUF3048 domain-containing protein n=1 Tax=Actinotalea sp. K2 TaxID=2939438 RepID=UPI002016FE91|nr:DUF3048 domain-containing protein [Actinotalea sp. K2]MCL3863049.1 DUF3048 domain-containing protein [Actinotalea sp. K2]
MARTTATTPQHVGPQARTTAGRVPGAGRAPHRPVRAALAGMVLVSLALVSACSSPPAPEAPDPVTVTPTIDDNRGNPPEPVVPVVWPLTGVPVEAVPERPAVSVKIENTSSVRPQSGLDQADVVWETIVEFEVSRFVAVFHSQVPEEVGPIRSVRPMDPAITAPMRGLIAFSGGQPGILAMVDASASQPISQDAGAGGMYRIRTRSAPHNVYGSVQAFIDEADENHRASPAQQFAFAQRADLATAPAGGTPAGSLAFRLSGQSSPSWAWDPTGGVWLRSEGSTPATAPSGAQLTSVNVVAVTANHPATGFGAQGGAAVPTYELVGEGPATVATGGHVVEGTWRKGAEDAPMELVDAGGQPILLAPGNTWVEMIPAGKGSLTVG